MRKATKTYSCQKLLGKSLTNSRSVQTLSEEQHMWENLAVVGESMYSTYVIRTNKMHF